MEAEDTMNARVDPIQAPDVAGIGRISSPPQVREDHPYVSPLNGEFRGLTPMIIFSGTRDLFYPDSIDLAVKARAAGVPVDLHLRRDQPHNYAGLPTPEGRQARAIILRAVGATTTR
jgi:acetyl esterase/lipase